MTYLELEQENKALKALLGDALQVLRGLDEHQALQERITLALHPPKVESNFGGLQKWAGEECGNRDCFHSSNSHAGKKGLCSVVDCVCMKFVPTGRPNRSGK